MFTNLLLIKYLLKGKLEELEAEQQNTDQTRYLNKSNFRKVMIVKL